MTGFGRGEANGEGGTWIAECASINRKQLEVVIQFPREMQAGELEAALRPQVQARVSRGRVLVQFKLQSGTALAGAARVDEALARAYALELQALARHLGIGPTLSLAELARLPGVVQPQTAALPNLSECAETMRAALDSALNQMIAMRETEGSHLQEEIGNRLSHIEVLLGEIRQLAPEVTRLHREQLAQRLADAGMPLPLDDERLLKELALFADRCDISEELSRATSHLNQFRALLAADEPAGRGLDFLSQEFFREFNTMGAKANHARLSHCVVTAKTELEKIREQVQNLE